MAASDSGLEYSIHGDALEQDRIALEHNLQHTELDLRLSDADSLEYPRHISHDHSRSVLDQFASFARDPDSGFISDHPDWDARSRHGWSQDPAHTFAAETVSTVAHHASALTLTAGLGRRARGRRDLTANASLSGAEYDPDRPLDAVIAGVDTGYSGFDPSSKHPYATAISFDPLIVDDTTELDKVLASGRKQHATPSPIIRVRSEHSSLSRIRSPQHRSQSHHDRNQPSPLSSSSSSSSSEASQCSSPRPKLSDALAHVAFSPKRPRTQSPRVASQLANEDADRTALPKFRDGRTHDHTRLHVPTAAGGRSGLGIQLPDVTGLTSAVGTPLRSRDAAKLRQGYRPYLDNAADSAEQAHVLKTLKSLQVQMSKIEGENGVARRRVRELEDELEKAKGEVVRERTRIMEQAEARARTVHEAEMFGNGHTPRSTSRATGQRARLAAQSSEAELVDDIADRRYREVVEEKKALEALTDSLRSHLTRLTSEVQAKAETLATLRQAQEAAARDHQAICAAREADSRAIQSLQDRLGNIERKQSQSHGDEFVKLQDLEPLRQEVERLSGEVEVLTNLVEEGLRERRASRDAESSPEDGDQYTVEATSGHNDRSTSRLSSDALEPAPASRAQYTGAETDDEEEEPPKPPIARSPDVPDFALPDRTMRTDRATLGSNSNAFAGARQPFIDDEELQRIAGEVSERRSERSLTRLEHTRSESPSIRSRLRGAAVSPMISRSASRASVHSSRASSPARSVASRGSSTRGPRPGSRIAILEEQADVQSPLGSPLMRASALPRPAAPTPAHAARRRSSSVQSDDGADAFPRIHGTRLERLFFSAPPHNEKTCRVCNCRRRPTDGTPLWLKARRVPDVRSTQPHGRRRTAEDQHDDDAVPPQTVLVRVLRELEDDFTHFKGIYVELAEQYAVMDAASNVQKRNVLAQHLREVIDCLEQKGDQIASLYDLLHVEDKPIPASAQNAWSQNPLPGRDRRG